jgi:chromosome segregation ATPase
MAGTMADEVAVWTLSAVRKHLQALLRAKEEKDQARFSALEKSMTAALHAAEQATLKAEQAAEKRLDSVNEFRNTLSDQQRNLMPRSEVAVVAGALSDKIQALESALHSRTSALESSLANRIGASAAAFESRLNALEKQLDTLSAERAGIKGGWGYAVGLIGFLLALGSLVMIGVKFIQATP